MQVIAHGRESQMMHTIGRFMNYRDFNAAFMRWYCTVVYIYPGTKTF